MPAFRIIRSITFNFAASNAFDRVKIKKASVQPYISILELIEMSKHLSK